MNKFFMKVKTMTWWRNPLHLFLAAFLVFATVGVGSFAVSKIAGPEVDCSDPRTPLYWGAQCGRGGTPTPTPTPVTETASAVPVEPSLEVDLGRCDDDLYGAGVVCQVQVTNLGPDIKSEELVITFRMINADASGNEVYWRPIFGLLGNGAITSTEIRFPGSSIARGDRVNGYEVTWQ